MGKLQKLMQIRKRDDRIPALLTYAKKLGVSTHYLVNQDTGKYNEPELVKRIREVEQHKDKIKISVITIIVTVLIAYFGGGAIYNVFIYPPKYNIEAKLYKVYPGEYKVNLIVKNINRGAGEIEKPNLIIYSNNLKKSIMIEPKTKFIGEYKASKTNGTIHTSSIIDKGKIIKVSGYGVIHDEFIYRLADDPNLSRLKKYNGGIKSIIAFLEKQQANLKYKISGYPYDEIEVTLLDEK